MIKSWCHYLYGNHFVLTTNDESLKYFCDQQNVKGRKALREDLIHDSYLSLWYRKGSMNTIVDVLSLTKITLELYDHLRGKYLDDNYFAKYWRTVESITDITTTSKDSFHIANSMLYCTGKVCVPDFLEVKKRNLFECHDAPSTRHPRIHHTLVLIATLLYWPKMCPNIHSYVTKCHQCQVNKAERLKADALLHPLKIPNNKWESISMDFIVSFPCTQKGHDAI